MFALYCICSIYFDILSCKERVHCSLGGEGPSPPSEQCTLSTEGGDVLQDLVNVLFSWVWLISYCEVVLNEVQLVSYYTARAVQAFDFDIHKEPKGSQQCVNPICIVSMPPSVQYAVSLVTQTNFFCSFVRW